MAKILRFENTSEVQLQLADRYLAEGRIPCAVQALRNAVQSGADRSARMQLGEVYLRAGLVGQAFDTFAEAYADGDDSSQCLFGLCRSAFFMGYDVESADYFKQIFLKNLSEITKNEGFGCDIDEMSEEFSAITAMVPNNNGFTFVKNNESREFSEEAMAKLRECPEKALPYFESFTKSSPLYWEARNNVALINLMLGAVEEAKAECKKVLAHDDKDVFALSTLLAVYAALEDYVGVERTAEKIESINVTDEDRIRKVALAMCQSNLHEKAVKYLERLDEHRYEKNIMLLLAIAYYNTGATAKSLGVLKDMQKLYPKDGVMIGDFIKRVSDNVSSEIEYSINMSHTAVLKNIAKCRKWFGAEYEDVCFDANILIDALKSDENYNLLYWYLTNHAYMYKSDEIVLLFRLCETNDERAVSILTDVLLDGDTEDYLKCKCVRVLTCGGWKRPLYMVRGAKLLNSTPIYPKVWKDAIERGGNVDMLWTEAFSIAYAELFMRHVGFESQLAEIADEVYRNLLKADPLSVRTPFAIAAVMYKRIKACQDTKTAEIREIFSVSPKTFIKYDKICFEVEDDETY